MLSHGVTRWGACFVFSTPSIDLAREGAWASWKLGSVARTVKTCRQCANHVSYIPRCPSFSWVSSADTQDFGGWLVNILTSCITRDFRAHLSFEIRQVGPTSDEPTLGLPHDQICWAGPSALLPQTSSKLSPDGDLQCRIAAGVASTHVSWLRRMCPGFDAPNFRLLSPRHSPHHTIGLAHLAKHGHSMILAC